MKSILVFAILLGCVALSTATVYFSEKFDEGWEQRWVKSKAKEAEGSQGTWGWSAGKFHNDAEADKGLQTTQDARFYQISAAFPKFSNKGKDLILQYSVKHEQNLDCGGGYVKLLPEPLDQEKFNGDSPYNVMFGPDICGYSTKKTHLIFTYKGKNHLIKKDIKAETDQFTHLYRMILHPDNTYEVQIDGKEVAKVSLKEDWDMLPAKEIPDPKASKPSDWVDAKMIPDPSDKKPEGWDDIPKEMADPDAKKPEDWDDELDGEWEPPMIPNPDYKGEWQPKMIENPDYKGEWVHPMVPNPDYYDDDNLYLYENNRYLGIEVWQVKSGTIFDNFIVTDDIKEADAFANLTTKTQEGEKKMKEKQDEEEKKRQEEEAAKNKAEDKDEDEEAEEENVKDEL